MQKHSKVYMSFNFKILKRLFFFVFLVSFASCNATFGKNYSYLREIRQETLVPTRWDVGNTTVSNEDRLDILIPYVKNIGNVYIGVGSEQNLTIAAWAKSEFIYLMDFTSVVVTANEMMVFFLQESPTKEKFLYYYSKAGEEDAMKLIREKLPNPESYTKVYKKIIRFVRKRHKTNLMLSELYHYKMFQTDDDQYAHVHRLAKEGKIFPVRGNLLGTVTLQSIGENLRKNNLRLGIIYFSNAEEYFYYPDQFKNSILNLPMKDESVVVRTLSVKKNVFPWAPGSDISTKLGFHYCVQSGHSFQEWLTFVKAPFRSLNIMEESGEIDPKLGFTYVGKGPGQDSL
ncbi:hypothetical protein LPTSP3_g29190 [Leptospira kobayashii]|uniref:DUF7790 domain-containing protein n=2 Tax=Leptospira kobayashii TaxID=1917830 RepID=A0ABM7ULW3_9LEPT|nr:hypothetical protein LPTSP3_g29190 [Leptospira kobayashii]